MKMACSGGHFLVVIREDMKENHEKNITFSWNPNLFPDGAEEKSCQNDGGWWFCGKWNSNVLLNRAKDKSGRDEDGWQLFGKK